MISTKEVLEDVFGHVSSRNKTDLRNNTGMSVERTFFHTVINPRWKTEAWPCLSLQPGDLQNREALNFARGRNIYIPTTRKDSSETLKDLKALVDAGPYTRLCMCGCVRVCTRVRVYARCVLLSLLIFVDSQC